jgi:hypothetical protein
MTDPILYQMLAIRTGLRAYAKHKMLLNRHWTPSKMMATAARLCETSFKPHDYEGAAKALERAAEKRALTLNAEAAVRRAFNDKAFGEVM